MLQTSGDAELEAILAAVSRSFFLSMTVLPRPLRQPIGLAYLIARAADTVADTEVVRRDDRRELLALLRQAIADRAERMELERRLGELPHDGATSAEARLLVALPRCLDGLDRSASGDRRRINAVLDVLLGGMERDLERFAAGTASRPVALESLGDLEAHCFAAAGCVGRFWSEMAAAHLPRAAHLAAPHLVERGVRLGLALQMINVIRDAPRDLAAGRCYIPAELLRRHALAPRDLVGPSRRAAGRLFEELRGLAFGHVDAAWPYVRAIPGSLPRLRLACVWPLWIGLRTLGRHRRIADPLDPQRTVKVPRRDVYGIVASSLAVVAVDPLLDGLHQRLRRTAERD